MHLCSRQKDQSGIDIVTTLYILIAKLAPKDLEVGAKYIEKSFHRTAVIRMDIASWSGKRKQVHGGK